MHEELDQTDGAATLDAETQPAVDEDREGCELINGVWVPKHPLEMPPDDDRPGCELIDGVWVEKPMSSASGVVEANLTHALLAHVRAHRSGLVISQSGMYQLFASDPKQIRKPDVSFIRSGRLPNDVAPAKGRIQLAPDLAAEVVSPTDIAEDVERKIDEYLRAGVRLVWVLYMPTRNVWAYKADGTAKLYRATDALPGEDVLPGFSVPVAELFEGV